MESRKYARLLFPLFGIGVLVIGCFMTGYARTWDIRMTHLSLPMPFYTVGEGSEIETHTYNLSCEHAINEYQYETVSFNALNILLKLCSDHALDMNRFNLDYLKRNLKSYHCTQSWKYLSVPRPLIALASYPGSGNTWTRELIETVTGVYTGSIYKDWNFVGSNLCPARGKVFIIKTHLKSNAHIHPDCLKMNVSALDFTSALLILRNPYSAILAEFNRENARNPSRDKYFNATGNHAAKDLFGSEKWRQFVRKEAEKWKTMAVYWVEKFERQTYVLVYEEITKNVILEMSKLTQFLNIKVTFNSLYCLSSNTTGNYHRIKPKWMTIEQLYDTKLRKLVNKAIEDVYLKVGSLKNLKNTFHTYFLPVD